MTLLTFEDAIARSADFAGNRHLLLGNGFSIACRPESFQYGRLFDEADFGTLSIDAGELFDLTGTSDFEAAIKALIVGHDILSLYEEGDELLDRVSTDAESLKDTLAEVLARKHPDNTGDIEFNEYQNARRFLSHFDSGNLYTLNYDLLLYWTLMQTMEPSLTSDDGFREDPDVEDAEWVTWDGFEAHGQRIYHLHGGLHLYESGTSLKKITWSRTGIPLVDQIRDALSTSLYPHVVTEGTSAEKLAKIEHSPYLHKGLKSLTNTGGTLFILGHSLAENDQHVLDRIRASKVTNLFVSLHGKVDSAPNQEIVLRAQALREQRERHEATKAERWRRQLSVEFFGAESAHVWR
jgi:hypothetical protein